MSAQSPYAAGIAFCITKVDGRAIGSGHPRAGDAAYRRALLAAAGWHATKVDYDAPLRFEPY